MKYIEYMKKTIAVIIIIAMMSVLLSAVSAAAPEKLPVYLNLGDSIASAYGLKNKTDGYASLLAKDRYTLSDIAVPGYDSADLLVQLSRADTQLKNSLASAEIITVSIGGNNFLGPFTNVLSKMDMSSMNIDINNIDPNKINQNDIMSMMGQFKKYFTPGTGEYKELTRELDKGEAQFKKDIDEIIKILAKNKKAEIIFLTVYNPYKGFDLFIKGFETMTETYIKRLNDIITEKAGSTYIVADVYSAFKKSDNRVVNANMLTMNMDVHPNTSGHKLIYKTVAHSLGFSVYFNDMMQYSWAVTAVDNLHEKSVVFGTNAKKREFSPEAGINHADLAIWFVRAFKLKIGDSDVADVKLPFSDIDKIPANALNSVKACFKAGIYSQMYPADKIYAFEPDKSADRLTAAIMAAQMINKSKWSDKKTVYTDLQGVSADCHSALSTLYEHKIMTGNAGGTFNPSAVITRGQTAKILYDILENPDLMKK